jgi:spermidine synthase
LTIKAEIKQGVTSKGVKFDVLYVNNRPLHWDTPEERAGQAEMVKDCYGDVLVAGYGLGISQQVLMQNPNLDTLLTVEKYRAVLYACKEQYGQWHGQVFVCDIWEYFKNRERWTDMLYDCIVGDIWSGSVAADVGQYKRFRKAAKKHLKPGGKIILGPRDV